MKEVWIILGLVVLHVCYLEFRFRKMRNVVRAMITLMFEDDEQ